MRIKRAFAVLLTLVFTAAALCGCSKQKEEAEETGAETENTAKDYVYTAEYHTLNEKGYYISSPVFSAEQKLMYLQSNTEESKLISMDLQTMETEEVPIALEENTYVTALGRSTEGDLLLGVTGYKEDSEDWELEQVMLKKLSEDGNELSSVDLGSTFLSVPDFYIAYLLADKDGNYYICTGQDVYVLNPDGSLLCQIPCGNYVDGMFAMKDGRVIVSYYGGRGYELKEVSLKEKSLKDVKASVNFDYGTYQSGVDTDLLYTQDSILYSCNLEDEQPVSILRWIDYDINSYNLQNFTILSDGRIAALTTDFMSGSGENELILLTRKDSSQVQEKTILTYGAFFTPYATERDIIAFNRQSDHYRIEMKEYGDDTTSLEDKYNLFLADLTSGQAPDIIDLTYCPLPFENLISAGLLEDLNPYLDADEVIKREDYVASAMKAYERDEKLYAIMPCFGVKVLIGKISEVGDGKTWTIDDMMELFDSKESGVQLFPDSTKSDILEVMCTMNQDMFVDEEAGKCDFTGEEFKKILEFSNQFPNETDYDPANSILEELRNGEILLYRDTVTSVQMYQMYEFMFGGPVNLIGYPTFGESGLTFSSNGTTVGMNAGSENKEGIWEFIRFNLTKERQEKIETANAGFPILRSALEKRLAEDMKAEYYEDSEGNKKEVSKSTWSTMDFYVDVYAATGEQVDRIMEMIENAQPDARMEREIFDIIDEEARGYFSGQKSADDVISVIQNRVQLYLNETR